MFLGGSHVSLQKKVSRLDKKVSNIFLQRQSCMESKFSLQIPVAVFGRKMWNSYLAQHHYTESRNLRIRTRTVSSISFEKLLHTKNNRTKMMNLDQNSSNTINFPIFPIDFFKRFDPMKITPVHSDAFSTILVYLE